MADTTGGEIPSLETSKDTMCDSQSDVESTAATNGTSIELDSQNEPSSIGVPSPSSTTVDSSVSSCSNSLDDVKKDDKSFPQSGSASQSAPFPSSFSVCSPVVSSCGGSSSGRSSLFAASRLNFAVDANSSRSPPPPSPVRQRPVLRPSQLASPGSSSESTLTTTSSTTLTPSAKTNSSPFVLKAPKLLSPKDNEQEEQNSAEAEPLCVPEKETSSATVSSNVQESCSSTENVTSSSSPTPVVSSSPPLPSSSTPAIAPTPPTPLMSFVPLSAPAPQVATGQSSGSACGKPGAAPVASSQRMTTATPSTTASQFVFGQNLHERVIVESSTLDTAASCAAESVSVSNNGEASCSSVSAATTNGTSEMLFSSVIQKELPDKSTENSVDDKNRKSLSEAAREYEESRAIKRKYEEVAVITGEEEENNILQMDCKLFVYDNNKLNYSEGVHGMLRVNDPPNCGKKSMAQSSRVIVRMSGSLRVLLNTKIWADMKIEKPNRKIVRMTAMDTNGQIKIFLISSSPSESEMLFRVLDSRIKLQKELSANCQNGSNKAEADECTSSSPS